MDIEKRIADIEAEFKDTAQKALNLKQALDAANTRMVELRAQFAVLAEMRSKPVDPPCPPCPDDIPADGAGAVEASA